MPICIAPHHQAVILESKYVFGPVVVNGATAAGSARGSFGAVRGCFVLDSVGYSLYRTI